jgi:glycosyltransferase involved in cell wall biosynthesis
MTGLRVLQVVDTLGMGGAETWLMEVLRRWSRDGTGRLDFLITSGNQGVFDEEAYRLGARLHYVRYGRRQLSRFAGAVRGILRDGAYHAIHDHQGYVSGWHFLLASPALPPIRVTHVHNAAYQLRTYYGVTPLRRATASIGMRLVARYATHVAGTSREVLRESGFDEPRFQSIRRGALYCGFDPARFLGDRDKARANLLQEFGWPADARVVLIAGRLDEFATIGHPLNQKNTGFAVAVGLECIRRNGSIRMLFAGASSEARNALEQQIAAAGFAGKIVFAGVRNDLPAIMLASDALLFPSRGEGLGMVAVEAQAAGLPVLASQAVPREAVVVPGLMEFKNVAEGTTSWANSVLDLVARERDVARANELVGASAFGIEQSSRALQSLYGAGELR